MVGLGAPGIDAVVGLGSKPPATKVSNDLATFVFLYVYYYANSMLPSISTIGIEAYTLQATHKLSSQTTILSHI